MNNTTFSESSPAIMIWHLEEISSHLVDIIFNQDATAADLFVVVMAFAIGWFLIFYVIKSIIRPLVHNKPWFLESLDKEYERNGKKMAKELNLDMTKEEFITFTMNDWPRMQAIYIQHIVGSLFCLPSILGIGHPSVASSLAICGVLSEIGWEVQDMMEMLFVRAFYKNGKDVFPDAIVGIFAVHHSLSSILGVPMVLYYRESRSLHMMCFDLQFAAAVALAIGEYTKLLDISKPSSLRQFKILNFFALVTMLWTRVFHWTYLCVGLYITWYRDGQWAFLTIGLLLSMSFTIFSFFCCVKPFYRKFIKFLNVSAQYETLSQDVTHQTRRASAIKLDEAVADLLAGDGVMELANMVEPMFSRGKTSRRQSVPVLSRKRRSLVMMHSKSFGYDVYCKSKQL